MNNFKEFLIESKKKRKINIPFLDTDTKRKIEKVIEENGGEIYIVGGAVRDAIRGEEDIKDIDFLVRFIPKEELSEILSTISDKSEDGSPKVDSVGASFGVVKSTIDGIDFDFALPRVSEDYDAKVESDLGSRDFTFNAMAVDMNGNLIDPFNGYQDIQNKRIKAVGDPYKRFDEDPLRMLRALQFSTRMGYDLEEKTKKAIETMQDELVAKTEDGKLRVAGDRVIEEFKKAWLKGKEGTKILIDLLKDTNIGLTLFGENFDPIEIKGKDVELQTLSFFFNGGEEKLRGEWNAPSRYLDIIDLARNFDGEEEPWTFVNDTNKKWMPVVLDFFEQVGNNVAVNRVEKSLDDAIPLSPKELDVSGKDLMDFGGIKGAEIGIMQRELLSAIWRGKVKNYKEKLLDYLFGEEDV